MHRSTLHCASLPTHGQLILFCADLAILQLSSLGRAPSAAHMPQHRHSYNQAPNRPVILAYATRLIPSPHRPPPHPPTSTDPSSPNLLSSQPQQRHISTRPSGQPSRLLPSLPYSPASLRRTSASSASVSACAVRSSASCCSTFARRSVSL